jgi:hypothetical protein
MDKSVSFVLGAIVGAAASALVGYVFAPARNTSFDRSYRSRMDRALAEGNKAAAEREAELRREFERSKRRHTPGETSV